MRPVCYVLLALFASLAQVPSLADTGLANRVLVVYNARSSDSRRVARHYTERRSIPEKNTCRISVEPFDIVPEEEFRSRIKDPVRKCLDQAGKKDILYIVLSYETPFAVTIKDAAYALDQFIADIWDEYLPARPAAPADPPHPYFAYAQSQRGVYEPRLSLAAYRQRPSSLNIYSVWRLDAPTPALAEGLVDKALEAERNGLRGVACFDRQFGAIDHLNDAGAASGDWDIHRASAFAAKAGFPVIEDSNSAEFGTAPAPSHCGPAALYTGWYSLNHYNDAFTWAPGAIGMHLDSASAMSPRGGPNWSANAISKGITMTSGAVGEPFLEGLAHPDEVFLYLFQGSTAGDAFLRSTRWLKWKIINIGDPLYHPIRSR